MRGLLRGIALLCIVPALLIIALPLSGQEKGNAALVIKVSGVIDPVNARYVSRAVNRAEREGFRFLIVRLDTPGGLDSSMRDITQKLLNAQVPTVSYVSPAGARAASAGVFITAAAHVAAMAPGTNLGAAHPVSIGGELPETVADKVTNDAAAYVRGIAIARGRNPDWYEQAVRKSISSPATEALEENVVDLIAEDLNDLLAQLHGRTVDIGDKTVTLDTQGLRIQNMGLPPLEKFLHFLVDPNIAFIFLTIGGLLLLSEVFHPTVAAGVVGIILLVLAFMALGNLPINWAGVGLLVFGVGLMAAEVFVPGFGILGIGGVAAFIVGGLILFSPFEPSSPTMPDMQVSLWVIVPITATLAGMFFMIFQGAWDSRKLKPAMVINNMIGRRGYATTDLSPMGTVQLPGELWSAKPVDQEYIQAGDSVEVVELEGAILKVRKVREP